ncbi:MAG: dUTP diphosphatase [Candidatus Ancillula sp.]|nr:dUTP diphosphatase [Candidatus Ancillula sp.]
MTNVLIQRIADVQIPSYANAGDAGADLQCVEDFTLLPGERKLVGTGVKIALEPGFVGLLHPRSGLAAKHGVTIVNAPGTIDAGYRGEIKVCLLNTDANSPVQFSAGDRIAQLVIQRFEKADFLEVGELPEAARGESGFGSSGK